MADRRTPIAFSLPVSAGLAWTAPALAALLAIGLTAAWADDAPPPNPTPAEKVVDVRISGNESIPLEKILPHIRTRKGRDFDVEQVQEDVRRLDRTRLFVDVKTYYQKLPEGRVVIFDVLERPLLQEVKYVGCKQITKKTLQKESKLKVGDPIDPYTIEEARHALEEYYHEKGFPRAQVTLLEGGKPEDRRAIFVINEGVKQKVLWISFIGNTIADDARLRTQIQTKTPFLWIFKGEYDRKQLDEDRDRLTAYYRGLGFFHARIGFDADDSGEWVKVTFIIDEGPRFKVNSVSVQGNAKYTSDELLADLKLKEGQYFNQSQLLADVRMLQDKYGSVGHVFADIKPDTRFLEEMDRLDLIYTIKEGDPYTVGKIKVDIKGDYPHTQITTVLNNLSFSPGDVMDVREIRASERRLRYSQLFESNPAQGNAPKITFRPPGQEEPEPDEERKPRRNEEPDGKKRSPRGGPMFRGQSPDAPPPAAQAASSANRAPASLEQSIDRARLILTQQYTPNGEQPPSAVPSASAQPGATVLHSGTDSNVSAQRPPSQWINAAPSQTSPASQTTAAPQTAAASASNPEDPAYVAQRYPRVGPDKPVETPQGQYVPGPLFSEGSPFLGGPPEGGLGQPLPVTVGVTEAMTGRLMFGAGVNSDAGVVGTITLDEQNFDWTRPPTSWEDIRNGTAWRGDGQRFQLQAMPGSQVQRYSVSFQEPYLFDTRVALGLSGFYFTRIYSEYRQQDLGGRVALGYQFSPDFSGSLAYRGSRVNITNPADPLLPDFAEVIHRDLAVHGFQFSLTRDKRDNAFMATEGSLMEASIEEVVGSFQYPRASVDLRKYFTLYERPDGSGRQVFCLAARGNYTGDDTPIYERFYAGGFSTIRGFDFRGVSPRSLGPSTGMMIPVGGNFMMLASAEYLFPITADDMLRGVVFCDTGTVERRINKWESKYRVAPGFGLRILVPAMGPAPIALDFAFPVSWEPGDDHEMFSFFVGFGR